jgi:hypothetical protein
MDGIELPEDHDYEESLEREFGLPVSDKKHRKYWITATAVIVLVLFVLGYFLFAV